MRTDTERASQIHPESLYPVLQAFADRLAERLIDVYRVGFDPNAEEFTRVDVATVNLTVSQVHKQWGIFAKVEVEAAGSRMYKREGELWVLLDTEPPTTPLTDEEFLDELERLFD